MFVLNGLLGKDVGNIHVLYNFVFNEGLFRTRKSTSREAVDVKHTPPTPVQS